MLKQAEVLSLTTETLKLARVAGVDYSAAADYMTVATRAFRIEVEEASRVTDVYSTLAASSASSTEELAIAMSKTASSAASVGASFENTTTMMAVMISATRESATNIGSAMKSIISRYGEMSSDPSKLVDAEGDAISFNKVDDALRSVGISMKDVNGQFRDFDDLIEELGSKWQSLDTLSQRYIATEFAGNRQQSRFLALVENYDLYKELQEKAMNSEDSGTLQYLKTLDSIETKIQQVKTAFQEFYTTSGLQDLIKFVLDSVTKILEKMNKMPKMFGKIPVTALSVVATLITTFKRMISNVVNFIYSKIEEVRKRVDSAVNSSGQNARVQVQGVGDAVSKKEIAKGAIGNIAGMAGAALTSAGLMASNDKASGALQFAGALGTGAATWMLTPGEPILKTIMAVATALPGLISGLTSLFKKKSSQEQVSEMKQNITDTHNDTLVSKNELKTLEDYKKKLDEAKAAQYDSVEAKQAYYDIMEEIADAYPQFFSYMDTEGHKIVELGKQYEELRRQKQEAYLSDLVEEGAANIAALNDIDYANGISKIYSNITSADISEWSVKGFEDGSVNIKAEDIGSSTNKARRKVYDTVKDGSKASLSNLDTDTFYYLLESLTGVEHKTFRGIALGDKVKDNLENAVEDALAATQEGLNYDEFVKQYSDSATYVLKDTYEIWQSFFKNIETANGYISSLKDTQVKQVLAGYNQLKEWGLGNSEQQYYSDIIFKIIQDETSGIKDNEKRQSAIKEMLSGLGMVNSPDEWIKQYADSYVNLWEGVDEATKKSIDELAAKSNDTSAAVFETKLRKLLGNGHEELIQNLMQEYADTVEWTTEDFTNALKEYSSQKERESVDISSFENLTPAMQQSLIASLKSADGNGNRGLVGATENLYSFLNNLNEVQMGIASEIVKTADFTNISGLRKFQQEMAKNNIDVSAQVEKIKANTNFNLVNE